MSRPIYILRQTVYTVFSFSYFLLTAFELTVYGFVLLTLGGASDEHKLRYHRRLQRRARYVMNHIPGTTFSFSNPHGETFEKPAVIVCNHQSHIDLMAVMMLTPHLIILTKGWVWRNPFYGIIIRYADYFPVTETEQMTRSIEEKVRKGYSVVVFPEGTRAEDTRILRFHRGAFYLAEQTGLDIVPVFIDGFGKVLPKKSFHLHPGHLTVEVMPRVKRDDPAGCPGYRDMTKQMHRLYVAKKAESDSLQSEQAERQEPPRG